VAADFMAPPLSAGLSLLAVTILLSGGLNS